MGQRDLWDLIVNNDDICFKHILPWLNRNDIKFLYDVNTETRALIQRSFWKYDLKESFRVEEMSSISTLEFVWENRSLLPDWMDETKFCLRVARTNKLELLKWIREEKKCEWDRRTMRAAAKQGNLEMVKYCGANECPIDADSCAFAVVYGHLKILKYFIRRQVIAPWQEISARAAENGHLHILKYLAKYNWQYNTSACSNAALNGHLDCLAFLHERARAPWDWRTAAWAAGNGHLHILKYLLECEYEVFDKKACQYAAAGGHLDCLKCLHEVAKVPLDSRIANAAAEYGHLNILEYLVEREYDQYHEYVCSYTAIHGHINCLEYLDEVAEAPLNQRTAEMAATNGHLDILEYLVEREYNEFHENVCEYAAENGHLDCLKYLYEIVEAPWDSRAVAQAHLFDRTECLQYLLVNDCPLPHGWRYEGGVLHTS